MARVAAFAIGARRGRERVRRGAPRARDRRAVAAATATRARAARGARGGGERARGAREDEAGRAARATRGRERRRTRRGRDAGGGVRHANGDGEAVRGDDSTTVER